MKTLIEMKYLSQPSCQATWSPAKKICMKYLKNNLKILKQTISISTSCRTSMKNIGTCTRKMEDWNSWTTLLQMAKSNIWDSLQIQKWIWLWISPMIMTNGNSLKQNWAISLKDTSPAFKELNTCHH